MVKTSDCGSDIRGFESHYPPHLQKTFLKRLFLLSLLKCVGCADERTLLYERFQFKFIFNLFDCMRIKKRFSS